MAKQTVLRSKNTSSDMAGNGNTLMHKRRNITKNISTENDIVLVQFAIVRLAKLYYNWCNP